MTAPSLKNPQLTPNDHCYMVIQDHGPSNGGWGPASIYLASVGVQGPAVYTGNDTNTIMTLSQLAQTLAQSTGKPTRFIKFVAREDLACFDEGGFVVPCPKKP